MKKIILLIFIFTSLLFMLTGDSLYSNFDDYVLKRFLSKDSKPLAPGNAVVYDTETGLMWQRGYSDGEMTFSEANKYCNGLTLDGFNDWMLPNIFSLSTIATETLWNFFDWRPNWKTRDHLIFIYEDVFPLTGYYFWSTTERDSDNSYVWKANYYNGHLFPIKKTSRLYARCVRNPGKKSMKAVMQKVKLRLATMGGKPVYMVETKNIKHLDLVSITYFKKQNSCELNKYDLK